LITSCAGFASDPESALAAVLGFEKDTGLAPAGVVPLIDGILVAGWAIADHYGVPYLSRAAVVNSSINKNLMKDRFVAAGLATPRYVQVDSIDAVWAAIAEVGLPCVIPGAEPLFRAAGRPGAGRGIVCSHRPGPRARARRNPP
jgi:formate-dependent phosphoribosylglycinamide formyltransferase (GAR transformylase)